MEPPKTLYFSVHSLFEMSRDSFKPQEVFKFRLAF